MGHRFVCGIGPYGMYGYYGAVCWLALAGRFENPHYRTVYFSYDVSDKRIAGLFTGSQTGYQHHKLSKNHTLTSAFADEKQKQALLRLFFCALHT